jgi:hypothetical protein
MKYELKGRAGTTVSKTTGYGVDSWGSTSVRGRDISLHHHIQTSSGHQQVSRYLLTISMFDIYCAFNTRISNYKIQVPLFLATCLGIKYHLQAISNVCQQEQEVK